MATTARIPVLIIGAGPTGLAAALFLSRRGISVRIIDTAAQPASTSKALLVNPRTLEVLGESGVAAKIIEQGWRVTGATMHRDDVPVVSLDLLAMLPEQRLIGIAQAHTEALLAEALQAQGVTAERGVTLQALHQDTDHVTATLQHADGRQETAEASLVFGADGARSVVRHQLGLDFAGHTLPEIWKLWDLRLDTRLEPQRAHIVLLPDGMLFIMALKNGVWRVLGNSADPLAQLPLASVPGEISWQSEFRIAHRLASHVSVGRVALGGDAAHIHSPLGARGMNLGIEDAYVFADCACDALRGELQRIAEYQALRQPVHRKVVRRIALMTRVMRGKPPLMRMTRDALVPKLAMFSLPRDELAHTLTGLDHPLRTRL